MLKLIPFEECCELNVTTIQINSIQTAATASATVTSTTSTTTTTTTTTTTKNWCNLWQYHVRPKRLKSSNGIILIELTYFPTYNDAKSACKNLCGSLYFPSTLDENNEVEAILANQKSLKYRDIWLRKTSQTDARFIALLANQK